MDLWYNEPIDHDSGVAERKGSLNRRCRIRCGAVRRDCGIMNPSIMIAALLRGKVH